MQTQAQTIRARNIQPKTSWMRDDECGWSIRLVAASPWQANFFAGMPEGTPVPIARRDGGILMVRAGALLEINGLVVKRAVQIQH